MNRRSKKILRTEKRNTEHDIALLEKRKMTEQRPKSLNEITSDIFLKKTQIMAILIHSTAWKVPKHGAFRPFFNNLALSDNMHT